MKIQEIEAAQLRNAALQARATIGGVTSCTRLFAATENGVEVGFLSIDFKRPPADLEIYEIFVIVGHRQRSVGNSLLAHAEELARKNGYSHVLLKPKPLDTTISEDDLIGWYTRKGFVTHPAAECLLRKSI